jgi:hypothetical protein
MPATIRIKASPRGTREGMNRLESRYADLLDVRKAAGEIKDWYWQPCKWVLANQCTYCPDFMVVLPDDRAEFHETKGFMREDAWVKVRVAARRYPFPFFLVFWTKKSGWDIREVQP